MKRRLDGAIFRRMVGGTALCVFSFVGGAQRVAAAPVISAITTVSRTATDVYIDWTTDVGSDEFVDYGTTASYGNTLPATTTCAVCRHHIIYIPNLTPSTLYHYRVRSSDASGLATSSDLTFTTFALPGVGTVQGTIFRDDNSNGIKDTGEPYIRDASGAACSASDSVQTNVGVYFDAVGPVIGFGLLTPTICSGAVPMYSYTTVAPGSYIAGMGRNLPAGWTLTTADNIPVTVTNGGTATANFGVHAPPAVDVTPPVISGLFATPVYVSSAGIQWTTNEQATGRVDYGTTPSLGSVALQNGGGLALGRLITLTGLTANTLYYYKVTSADASGNTASSAVATFTTSAGASFSACDLNQDSAINVLDVQREVNQALGILPCVADINLDSLCNVIDVQRVANAAIGGPCVSP
jgi:hypothetical protein